MKKFAKWFTGLTSGKKVLFILAVVIVLSSIGGAAQPDTTKTATKKSADSSSQTQHQPTITTNNVVEKKDIPFGSTTVQSSSLAKGTTKITTAGVNGTEVLTYEVTYSDGQQTQKHLLKDEVAIAPVTQVTTVGTYVAPSQSSSSGNTYTNVDGNQIESPDGNSSGATGVCNDGSYTHAVHHQGACSSHGGVSYWL